MILLSMVDSVTLVAMVLLASVSSFPTDSFSFHYLLSFIDIVVSYFNQFGLSDTVIGLVLLVKTLTLAAVMHSRSCSHC